MYNDYAFRMGFSVRKRKQYYVFGSRTLKMKKFHCSKAGFKVRPKTANKCYSKV